MMPLAEPPPRDSRFGSPLKLSRAAGGGRGSDLSDVDRRQPASAGLLPGPARGQAGAPGSAAGSASGPALISDLVPFVLGIEQSSPAAQFLSRRFPRFRRTCLGCQSLDGFTAGRGDAGAVDAGRQPVADHGPRPMVLPAAASPALSRIAGRRVGLLLGPPTAPDLLMSDDGRVLGLRNEKGVVHVASIASSDTWARRSGQDGAKRWLAVCSRCLKCALQEKSSGTVTNRLEMGFGGTYSGSQESHS